MRPGGKIKKKATKKTIRGRPPMVRPPGVLAVNAPYGGYKKLPK